MILQKLLAQPDHVLSLVLVKADGLDVVADPVFTKRQHLLRRICGCEQRAGRLVHPDVGRLRRQHDSDQ